MIAFLIPIFVVIFITIFSVGGGNILKTVGSSFPDLRSYFFLPKTSDQKEQKQTPAPSVIRKTAPTPPSPIPDTPIVVDPNISPYFQKVAISSLSTGTHSLITLKANLKQGEEISITGWKIRGKAGSFQIPLGIERINPSSSLQPGDLIKLKTTDTVYLSSSRGPFGLGKHFRPNTCMGYLKSSYTFPLAVPSSCSTDKPREEDLLYFLQACQDFIFKKIDFSSCAFPDYAKDLTVSADTQCTSYLTGLATGFTYNSCFLRHSDEPNFTTNAWQVFMNTNLLTQKFDTIELVDQNGLVVDQEKYSL
jgi:hypothetical protein